MNAALLFLTEAWRYEQVEETDLTAEETAAKWYQIYVQYLTGECEGVGCCTELRTDPNTGRLQYTEDGGLTWFDVAEGPWVDAPNVASADAPPPLNQGTDAADRCLAAWNAADVIAEFYRQTAGAAAAGIYNTLLSMNMFLNELNNALLEIAYPQAGRLLNASGFLDFDWGEYAEAPTLDSTAMEALRCLLYCNASVTGGIVSFDHGAVYDNLIADLGINPGTAVTLLVGYMGAAGLNHAGGILANDSATCDCPECDTAWCYEETNLGDWTIEYGSLQGDGSVLRSTGTNYPIGVSRTLVVDAETVINKIEATWVTPVGAANAVMFIQADTGKNFGPVTQYVSNPVRAWTGETDDTSLDMEIYWDTGSVNLNARLTKVRYEGTGPNPFGESNC